MSEPTPTERKNKHEGIPVGRMLIVLTVIGIAGLAVYGARGLFSMVKITDFPITGEWQAKGKPWRIDFRSDKTVVSLTDPSQAGASQATASEPGTYKLDYFGNLWVMLKNGRTFTASLTPPSESGGMAASPPLDRFDLIESGTESVTVFEKLRPAQPKKPHSPE